MTVIGLVQGLPSARFWLSNDLDREQIEKWVVCDALAAEWLALNGFTSIVNERAYIPPNSAKSQQWDRLAHQLSRSWFETFSPPRFAQTNRVRFEALFSRTFNYCFLALFRAVALLDHICQKEGHVHIVTTELEAPTKSIRWEADEPLFPLLLKYCNDRWKFSYQLVPLNLAGGNRQKQVQSLGNK